MQGPPRQLGMERTAPPAPKGVGAPSQEVWRRPRTPFTFQEGPRQHGGDGSPKRALKSGPENTPRALAGRLGVGVSQVGTGDEPRREGPGWGRGRDPFGGIEKGEGAAQASGYPGGPPGAGNRPRGRPGPGAGVGVQGRGSAGGTPRRGGQPGPQAAPGRRSPRPCPSGRSGPWRRREARLARSAFGLSAPAPAPAAASTGSARRSASLLVGGSSGCHVGQALKGPRRRARPGRALKGPRTARSRTAPRALRPRPPRSGHAHPSRRAAALAAHTGPAHHSPAPPAAREAPPIVRFKAGWPGLEGLPAGATHGNPCGQCFCREGHGVRQMHLELRIPPLPSVGDEALTRRSPY